MNRSSCPISRPGPLKNSVPNSHVFFPFLTSSCRSTWSIGSHVFKKMGPQYGRITTWNGGTWWSKGPLGTLLEQDVNFYCELTVKNKTKHQSYPPPIYSTDSWVDTMWHQCSGCWRYGGESPSFIVREIILKIQNIISSHDECHEKTLNIPALAFFSILLLLLFLGLIHHFIPSY